MRALQIVALATVLSSPAMGAEIIPGPLSADVVRVIDGDGKDIAKALLDEGLEDGLSARSPLGMVSAANRGIRRAIDILRTANPGAGKQLGRGDYRQRKGPGFPRPSPVFTS